MCTNSDFAIANHIDCIEFRQSDYIQCLGHLLHLVRPTIHFVQFIQDVSANVFDVR